MHRLGQTIEDLNRARQQWLRLFKLMPDEPAPEQGPLVEVQDFGPNPGQLRMQLFVPAEYESAPALVVVLHGCGQTPAQYERRAGWCALAAKRGFLVCYPQQREANNAQTCFNWFSPRRRARDMGEAASIRSMIAYLEKHYQVDRARIFITGFSAGGAMTASMLAAYPEVFSAGAVLAGLAVGIADSVPQALEAMSQGDKRPGPQAAVALYDAAPDAQSWPRLLVWHGLADEVVAPANAGGLARQWRHALGLRSTADSDRWLPFGRRCRIWHDAQGRPAIEHDMIVGFGHKLAPQSTPVIAEFFGLMSRGVMDRLLEKWHSLPNMQSLLQRWSGKP